MSTQRARRVQPVVAPGRPQRWSAVVGTGTALAILLAVVTVWNSGTPEGPIGPTPLPEAAAVVAEGEDADEGGVDDELVPISLPLVAYELVLARDPFQPVVPEPEPAPADPSDPTAPGDPTAPSDPTAPGAPTAPGTPTAPGGNGTQAPSCTTGSEVVCDGRVLTVVEILEENGVLIAVIQVDTMRWRVEVGDVFADVFQVLSISADEVRVLYGDRIVTILVRDNALK